MTKSYYHRGGNQALLGRTIGEHFDLVSRRHSGKDAVVSLHQGRRMSYTELARAIDRLACGLIGLGFGRGNRIGIWSTNNIEWMLVQMATARIGAVLVNLNPGYRCAELDYALSRCEIQGIFTIPSFLSSNYVSMLLELIPELETASCSALRSRAYPSLRRVILYDPVDPEHTRPPSPGFTVWPQVLDAASTVSNDILEETSASVDIDDTVNIQYTSGTTGSPKAVMLSHHNVLNNAYFAAKSLAFGDTDRLCIPVPFYHCFGMVLGILVCLSVGACVVIPSEHFDAEATLQAIQRERCTASHGVPTMFIAELEHPHFAQFDLTSLRTGIIAGAP